MTQVIAFGSSERSGVSMVFLVGLGTTIALGVLWMAGIGETDSSATTSSTGNPDPCDEAPNRIRQHWENYNRIRNNGASPLDIIEHGSEDLALKHYKGNAEHMQQAYNRLCK